MEERNRNNGIYNDIIRMRLLEMKAKIRVEKRKVKQELKKGQVLKNEIIELLSELSQAGVVDNSNEINEFMDSIDEKYGLNDSCETELSRLYVEIVDDFISHEDFEKSEEDRNDDDDENKETLRYVELINLYNDAERKFLLCKSLFNRAELSNFEHKMLKDKLEDIKRQHMEKTQLNMGGNMSDSRLEDFCY